MVQRPQLVWLHICFLLSSHFFFGLHIFNHVSLVQATMSLHDQLLADLEDLDDEGDVAQEELAEDAEMDDADEELQDAADILASDDHKSVTAVAKLGNSEKVRSVAGSL